MEAIAEERCQTQPEAKTEGQHMEEDKHYKRLSGRIPISEIIQESQHYGSVELLAHGYDKPLKANRIVLAASSPFLKKLLTDVEEGGQVTITDCCQESLALTLDYIHHGYVSTPNSDIKIKTENLIQRLQIGNFSLDNLNPKQECDLIARVKTEPSQENDVVSYYKREAALKRKALEEPEVKWKENVIQSLYRDEEMYYNDFDDHSSEEEEYEKKPRKKKLKTKEKESPSKSKNHKCTECDMAFARKSNLIGHMRLHTDERPYVCDICGKSFTMQSGVTTHKKQSHPTEEKPWPCDYCEKRFVSRSQLELHKRCHTGEKPWVCDICGRGFAQKQNMLDHKRIHSDKMEYNCHTCGQQFKWKLQLERHMMDHTGVRPHPCDQCNLAFKSRNGLKSHKLSVHSETKHFVCQHCGSGFSTSSGVSRHQKNNRCSALKGLTNNEREKSNVPAVTQSDNTNEIKQEEFRHQRKDGSLMQNLASALNYPALSLAVQKPQPVQAAVNNFRTNV